VEHGDVDGARRAPDLGSDGRFQEAPLAGRGEVDGDRVVGGGEEERKTEEEPAA